MIFRPYPALTAVCAVLLAFLIGLGVWQLQRLQWKLALIAKVQHGLAEAPVSIGDAYGDALDVAKQEHVDQADYRRVHFRGRFLNDKEVRFFTTGSDGAAAYHVLTPVAVPDLWDFWRCSVCPRFGPDGKWSTTTGPIFHHSDGIIFVDRGYIPLTFGDPRTRPKGQLTGVQSIVGVLRRAEPPGWFTPAPDKTRQVYYSRDPDVLAHALGLKHVFPMLVEADATPNPGGWPKGGQTQVEFRNEHLQYAITWFLMAAGLFGVYLAYHVSKGRLTLTMKD